MCVCVCVCVCVFSLFCEAQSEILSLFFIQAIILPNVKQQKAPYK